MPFKARHYLIYLNLGYWYIINLFLVFFQVHCISCVILGYIPFDLSILGAWRSEFMSYQIASLMKYHSRMPSGQM